MNFKAEMSPVNYPREITFFVELKGQELALTEQDISMMVLDARKKLNISTVVDLIEKKYDLAKEIEMKILQKEQNDSHVPIPEIKVRIKNILIP